MEIKTCEQYVLDQLFEQQRENERLLATIAELKERIEQRNADMAKSPDGEVEPREVQMFKLNEPYETAYLSVQDEYRFKGSDGLNMTAAEIRAVCSDEERLRDLSEKRVGYCREKLMDFRYEVHPYQLRVCENTFVLDTYDGGESIYQHRVMKDSEKLSTGRHFPRYRGEELERYGMGLLKERLLKYADKLDEEASAQVEDGE